MVRGCFVLIFYKVTVIEATASSRLSSSSCNVVKIFAEVPIKRQCFCVRMWICINCSFTLSHFNEFEDSFRFIVFQLRIRESRGSRISLKLDSYRFSDFLGSLFSRISFSRSVLFPRFPIEIQAK